MDADADHELPPPEAEEDQELSPPESEAITVDNAAAQNPILQPDEERDSYILVSLEAPILGFPLDDFIHKFKSRYEATKRYLEELDYEIERTSRQAMENLSIEEAQNRFKESFHRMMNVKEEEMIDAEEWEMKTFESRLDRLMSSWDTQRLDRVLVDYFLRMFYVRTALKFAWRRGVGGLFNMEAFAEAKQIADDLWNKNLYPAKDWCFKWAAQSELHFQLSCQEYIEYVRANPITDAKSFADKCTEDFKGDQDLLGKWLKVMPIMFFGCNTQIRRYKKLFDADRWDFLAELFQQQFLQVHRFTDAPSLSILLEAGITALKVRYCYCKDHTKEDPLQREYFSKFTEKSPRARPYRSHLLCHVTKKQMTDANPPQRLPNGYTYSKEAILQMVNDEGMITCPRSGSVFQRHDVQELKIMDPLF